jgi:hypothetical protein
MIWAFLTLAILALLLKEHDAAFGLFVITAIMFAFC